MTRALPMVLNMTKYSHSNMLVWVTRSRDDLMLRYKSKTWDMNSRFFFSLWQAIDELFEVNQLYAANWQV